MTFIAGLRCALAPAVLLLLAACGGDSTGPGARLARIEVTPSEPVVLQTGTVRLHATAFDADADSVIGVAFAWSSSDPAVATVAGDGTVTPLRGGVVTIAAAASGVQGTASVTVIPAEMNEAGPDSLFPGQTRIYTAFAVDEQGQVHEVPDARWESLTPAAMTVTPDGHATAVAPGEALLRVTAGEMWGTLSARVLVRGVAMRFWPAGDAAGPWTMGAGAAVAINAAVLSPQGDSIPGRAVEFLTSQHTVAAVGGGRMSAFAPGEALITARGPLDDVEERRTVRVRTFRFGAFAVGGRHACALTTVGETACWGWGTQGQLGTGQWLTSWGPALSKAPPLVALTAGLTHSCGLTPEGEAWCWGGNGGAIGDGTGLTQPAPVRVAGGHRFTAIYGGPGAMHTCALAGTAAWCWGRHNDAGIVGDGSTSPRGTPAAVAGGHEFRSLALGYWHTCGIATDSTAWCWGSNVRMALGSDPAALPYSAVPVPVPGGHRFTQLSAGEYQTCGLRADSTAACWGTSFNYLEHDMPEGPLPVDSAFRYVAITNDGQEYCATRADGALYCWNRFYSGHSNFTPIRRDLPVALRDFAMGASAWCGRDPSDRIACFGDNTNGAVGTALPGRTVVPQPVAGQGAAASAPPSFVRAPLGAAARPRTHGGRTSVLLRPRGRAGRRPS